jgi:non-specific serine/threonine protein kinase
MEFLAWCAEATGDAQRAARLFGCSRTLFEPLGAYLVSIGLFLNWHESSAQRALAELGTEDYRQAEDRGRALSMAEAVSYALGQSTASSTTKPDRSHSALTRRETQVAELVAEGLSNREIAQKLVIAPRTADSHVEHILGKLGFTSRAQVITWLAGRPDRSLSR